MTTRRLSVGPLSILFCCIAPAVGAVGIRDGRTGLICVGVSVAAVGWMARTDAGLGGLARRTSLGAVAAVSIFVSTFFYGGHDLDEALGAALRIMYLVLPGAVLATRVRPSALADHLAQRAHLPSRVAVSAAAALARIDSIAETWIQIIRARRARGLGIDGGAARRLRASAGAAFALLVASMRRASELAVAMDSRGFAHATHRTWAEPAPWLAGDWAVTAIGVILAAVPWFLR
jgi:energy-coupling factor transporter transmembrane protein EcfT